MANQVLVNEFEQAIRNGAKSYGIKGRSLAAIELAAFTRLEEMRVRRLQKGRGAVATLAVAAGLQIRDAREFEPVAVAVQVADHAAKVRAMIDDVRRVTALPGPT